MWWSKWVEGRVEGGVELEQLKGRGWDLGGWVRCMLNISKNQKNQKIKKSKNQKIIKQKIKKIKKIKKKIKKNQKIKNQIIK